MGDTPLRETKEIGKEKPSMQLNKPAMLNVTYKVRLRV
jgi:hypothetical protein